MWHRRRPRLRRPLSRRNHHPTGGDLINIDTARDNLCAAADHVNDDDPRHHRLVLAAIEFHRAHVEYLAAHLDDGRDELDQLRDVAIDAVLTVIASSWRLPAVDRYLAARTTTTHEVNDG